MTLKLREFNFEFLLHKSICSRRGESARRWSWINFTAESQVWISGEEKICLTGWLGFAFGPPSHFIWRRLLLLLSEQIFSVMRIHMSFHMFLQQTSWLYSESGHSSGPHFHWWTKESQSFVLCCVKNISFLRALYLIPSKLLHHSFAARLHGPRVHVMSRHWVLCKARCITFLWMMTYI